MSKARPNPHEARVTTSRAHYICAAIFAAIAICSALASDGGLTGAGQVALISGALCSGCLFWAAVNGYVRKIELRLIDIQIAIEMK